MIRQGWTAQQAAAVVGVNRCYLGLAKRLDEADLKRLAEGKLTLAQLHKDYVRRLAERRSERRASRLAAEVRVQMDAARIAEQERIIADALQNVGADRVFDHFLDRYGSGVLIQVLNGSLNRHGVDVVEAVITACGGDRVMRALDRYTQPELTLVAAE
jgi:hypothetical protein